jgi:hypothetical protein
MPQKKKLSLEEARALFAVNEKPQKRNSTTKPNFNPNNRGSPPLKRQTSGSPDIIKKRLSQLERKIEHESLSPEEEEATLSEIGRLEEQLKQI